MQPDLRTGDSTSRAVLASGLSAVLTGFVQQKRPQRLVLNVMERTMRKPMIPA